MILKVCAISLFLIINVVPTECMVEKINKTLFSNYRDLQKIMNNLGETERPKPDENSVMEFRRSMFSVVKKEKDEARTCGQLIESRGFNYKVYNVTTSDGYIITIYRIINPTFNGTKLPRPFLLVPGAFWSCPVFLANQKDKQGSLGYYLADRCQDVWIINPRGSVYSRNHTHYKPSENRKYYNYTYFDIGEKDIPAAVELIKSETGYSQINVVAYSQGTLELIVLFSKNPSYERSFHLIFFIGPIGYLGQLEGISGTLPRDPISLKLIEMSPGPFPPFFPILDFSLVAFFCTFSIQIPICLEFFSQVSGPDRMQVRLNRLPVYLSLGEPTSPKLVLKILQDNQNDAIREYDYGKDENRAIYGQEKPPMINYQNIPTHKIVLISGENDYIATSQNVQKLRNSVNGRFLVDHIVTNPYWGHLDFVFGKDADLYVNEVIFTLTFRYTPSESTINQCKKFDTTPERNSNSYSGTQANGNSGTVVKTDSQSNTFSQTNTNANTVAEANTSSESKANTNTDTSSQANSNSGTVTGTNSQANTGTSS
ncbi:lipase 3-like [Panonychus citri]|uniref:lipase 3-like n=1 Tax=Panonychus citri TaxID=50023 RepID=UPI002307FBFE|nr:lipase 3-like [Panonychus citri]